MRSSVGVMKVFRRNTAWIIHVHRDAVVDPSDVRAWSGMGRAASLKARPAGTRPRGNRLAYRCRSGERCCWLASLQGSRVAARGRAKTMEFMTDFAAVVTRLALWLVLITVPASLIGWLIARRRRR